MIQKTSITPVHNCPRRAEIGPVPTIEFLDGWEEGSSISGFYYGDPSLSNCSYCGSLHPDDFLLYLERGYTWVPTDKNYKAYLEDEEKNTVGKFYFQHLDLDQRYKVLTLLNEQRVKFAAPGYLYTLPYFAVRI